MKHFLSRALLAVLVTAAGQQSQAGVVINGTRVIYPAQAREVTVQVDNVGETPSLVQAWIDSGDPEQTAENSDAPFLLTPPISRVEPGRSQALRLIFTDAPLPSDRESVFWLNVLDVPPSPTESSEERNYLQVAFRSRIKLFFRPKGLPGNANDAPQALQWRHAKDRLVVRNPTAYFVTLAEVDAVVAGAQRTIESQGKMVGPGQELEFPVSGAIAQLRFLTINDYGGRVERHADLGAGP